MHIEFVEHLVWLSPQGIEEQTCSGLQGCTEKSIEPYNTITITYHCLGRLLLHPIILDPATWCEEASEEGTDKQSQ